MKSAMAISMHKAGSTIADKIFTEFFIEKGFSIDSIGSRVPKSPLSEAEVFMDYQKKMIFENIYYGIARGPYVENMPVINKLKVLLQVRDPRDCLVSAYFSFRESHRPPKDPRKLKAFMARREDLKNLDIDQFVLKAVGGFKYRMRVLSSIMSNHDDILVLKYESMTLDTEQWLRDISVFTDQPITPTLRNRIDSMANFQVAEEDQSKHKRQVTPGDHKRKLRPESVRKLSKKTSSRTRRVRVQ